MKAFSNNTIDHNPWQDQTTNQFPVQSSKPEFDSLINLQHTMTKQIR